MNNQFKVNDIVVRNDSQLDGIRAEVTRIKNSEWIGIRYLDGPHKATRAEWLVANAKLATEQVCKFVPGTTYKDRTGKEYRFVIYAEEAASPYRAVFLTSAGNITCRHSDGILNLSGRTSDLDILPNKKTRTIYVYRKENQLVATTESPRSPGYGWKLIGEVVEEYEEF